MKYQWGVVVAVVAGCASGAFAERVHFTIYENADNADLTGLDLWVGVTDQGTFAELEFGNDSDSNNPIAVITKIAFEKTAFSSTYLGAFSGIGPGEEAPGVDFTAESPNGIGGDLWNHSTGTLYQIGAEPPPVGNGIDVGERLAMQVAFVNGGNFASLLAALQNQTFRIVIHIQDVGDDQDSVWGVTEEGNIVPLPSAAGLTLAGLGLVSVRRRR